jgi:hypothetical protein
MGYPSFNVDFDGDFDVSHEPSYQLEKDAVYKQFFGVMGRLIIKRINEIDEQKGYDVLIKLDNGQFFKILEKHDRYKNTGNIVLELWSDINHTKGWLYTAQCDWMAYHYDATGITHFLPMPALRKAWNKYEAEWRDIYRIVIIENRGLTTQIILIPLNVLWEAMHDVMIHNHLSGDGAKWM